MRVQYFRNQGGRGRRADSERSPLPPRTTQGADIYTAQVRELTEFINFEMLSTTLEKISIEYVHTCTYMFE